MKRTFIRIMGYCMAAVAGIANRAVAAEYDGTAGGSAYKYGSSQQLVDGFVLEDTKWIKQILPGCLNGSYTGVVCTGVVDNKNITGYCNTTGIWCPSIDFFRLHDCLISGYDATPVGYTGCWGRKAQAIVGSPTYIFAGCLPGYYIDGPLSTQYTTLEQIAAQCALCSGLMYSPNGATTAPGTSMTVPTTRTGITAGGTTTTTPGGTTETTTPGGTTETPETTVPTDTLWTYIPSIVSGETSNAYFYWIAGNGSYPNGLNTNGYGISSCRAVPISGESMEFQDASGTFTLPTGCPYVE